MSSVYLAFTFNFKLDIYLSLSYLVTFLPHVVSHIDFKGGHGFNSELVFVSLTVPIDSKSTVTDLAITLIIQVLFQLSK